MVLVMRPTVVSGASMVPTLHDKDVLVASPLAKRLFLNRLVATSLPFACLHKSPTHVRPWANPTLNRHRRVIEFDPEADIEKCAISREAGYFVRE
jgi:hypothetical protein